MILLQTGNVLQRVSIVSSSEITKHPAPELWLTKTTRNHFLLLKQTGIRLTKSQW